MIWVVGWVLAMVMFMLVSICINPDARKRVLENFSSTPLEGGHARPAATAPADTAAAAASRNEEEQYHYVLSRTQEDEIRESFLIDALNPYTKTITEEDISEVDTPDPPADELCSSSGSQIGISFGGTTGVNARNSHDELTRLEVDIANSMMDSSVIDDKVIAVMDADLDDIEAAMGYRMGFTDKTMTHASSVVMTNEDVVGMRPRTETETSAESSDEASSDGDIPGQMGEEYLGDSTHVILVPLPGQRRWDVQQEPPSQPETAFSTAPEEAEMIRGATALTAAVDIESGDKLPPQSQRDPQQLLRTVPSGCTICLCSIDKDDRVTWSSNALCNHVFHNECILDWLKASGRKAMRRRRRHQEQRSAIVNYANDPILKITTFPMLCPCCRQDFVRPPDGDDDVHAVVKEPPVQQLLVATTAASSSLDASTVSVSNSSDESSNSFNNNTASSASVEQNQSTDNDTLFLAPLETASVLSTTVVPPPLAVESALSSVAVQ